MNSILTNDATFMQRAIFLAAKGKYTTSPNPAVGCVLVKDNQIIGEGWHQKAGQGHAEVNAIANATSKNQELNIGVTAYVTLEPCSHYGQTPPCAEGLIAAGIDRVVIAMQDPNPLVSGRGIAMLNAAGIRTTVGVLERAAESLNLGFIKRMTKGLPLLRCKMASSIDGKTAMVNGESKWITSTAARVDVQNFRAQSCAIISGADTVLTDNAKLNVRYNELQLAQDYFSEPQLRQPIRVIIDSKNRLTPDLALFQIDAPIILVRIDLETEHQWPHFVEQVHVKVKNGQADLHDLLVKLAARGLNTLWLESGGRLAGAFMQERLIDEVILYQAAKIMGDSSRGLFVMPGLEHLIDAIPLTYTDVRMVGSDLRITATVNNKQVIN